MVSSLKIGGSALFAAIALFLTPLGGLVKGVVGLLTAIIPKIVMAIAANPWSALALVGTGLAFGVYLNLLQGGIKQMKNLISQENLVL